MADRPEAERTSDGSEPVFPDRDIPILFADGVASIVRGLNGIFKFYLVRYDPNLRVKGGAREQIAAQIVMPKESFIATALFFEQQLKVMVAREEISEEELAATRAQFPSI
jgi:hypothetical protein